MRGGPRERGHGEALETEGGLQPTEPKAKARSHSPQEASPASSREQEAGARRRALRENSPAGARAATWRLPSRARPLPTRL